MKKEIRFTLALLVFFSMFFAADKLLFSRIYHFIEGSIQTYPLSFFITYLLVGLPVLFFVFFSSNRRLLTPLGLRKNALKGVLVALVFSIPMFIGYGVMSGFSININAKSFWFGCVFAAFFEELYYRGIFFGQLFKNTRLGFFPSLILSALIFASLHLYQSNDPVTMLGIFITTFMGAGLFAWLYSEWDFNLWVPIALHFFMNLSWEMFSVADNALGDLNAGLIRGLTILLAIAGTVIYKKKCGIPLTVNKLTFWVKSYSLS
jgi:membrane protease YdiL (CAAX protease family)